MGLDMYLNRVSENKNEEVMYWRKVNQIHGWMLKHFDADPCFNAGDEPLHLDESDTQELLNDLKEILDSPMYADEIMPVTEGFFFGSDEYDDYYFKQIRRTYEELSAINNDMDWEHEWLEYSCWW